MHSLTLLFVILAFCTLTSLAATNVAFADLSSGGKGVYGGLSFVEHNGVMHIEGTISNMKDGEHGLHIHSSGDVSDDCQHIGDHYNPYNKSHSCDSTTGHFGDLGNVISYNGTAHVHKSVAGMTLALSNGREGNGNPGVLGLSIAVDRDPDTCRSEDDGNSGPGIACGRIATLHPLIWS